MLGQQADVEVQVRPPLRHRIHAVLGDEDELRKKDGFHRSDHR